MREELFPTRIDMHIKTSIAETFRNDDLKLPNAIDVLQKVCEVFMYLAVVFLNNLNSIPKCDSKSLASHKSLDAWPTLVYYSLHYFHVLKIALV